MRDNKWLAEKMYYLWENYFADVARKNIVLIKFGKRSKRQLGSIRWGKTKSKKFIKFVTKQNYVDDKRVSVITITSFFKDMEIPEEVVLATIAHEMCHYAHGFNSPLKQIYNHPHKGGVIRKEMAKRGLEDIYKFSKKWLKDNWLLYLKKQNVL